MKLHEFQILFENGQKRDRQKVNEIYLFPNRLLILKAEEERGGEGPKDVIVKDFLETFKKIVHMTYSLNRDVAAEKSAYCEKLIAKLSLARCHLLVLNAVFDPQKGIGLGDQVRSFQEKDRRIRMTKSSEYGSGEDTLANYKSSVEMNRTFFNNHLEEEQVLFAYLDKHMTSIWECSTGRRNLPMNKLAEKFIDARVYLHILHGILHEKFYLGENQGDRA